MVRQTLVPGPDGRGVPQESRVVATGVERITAEQDADGVTVEEVEVLGVGARRQPRHGYVEEPMRGIGEAPGPTGCSFSAERLGRLAQLEGWHFWFAGRRMLVERMLDRFPAGKGQLVLDVGCGTGAMVRSLAARDYRVVGLDLHPEGLRAARSEAAPWRLIRADARRLPVADEAVGAVLLLDVLEHTDDRAALAEVHRVLRPSGVAIITVPAVPWLWSHRDEAAGHLCRYSRRRLLDAVAGARLAVETVRYYQCLLFPLMVVARPLGRRAPRLRDMEERPSRILNTALTWINRMEVRLGDVIPWPYGSSLMVVCRKP